ncbi:MAG: hypothetical protein QMD22_05810 [archaeon]|nr:hypothetical protein [archaeon]
MRFLFLMVVWLHRKSQIQIYTNKPLQGLRGRGAEPHTTKQIPNPNTTKFLGFGNWDLLGIW